MTQKKSDISQQAVPRHVAIIMDGNGRWAVERGMERSAGHVEGVNTVRRITEAASRSGVSFLTLYAFSTENWNRPPQEVAILMHLIVTAIERETPDLIRNNVRLQLIGDTSRIPDEPLQRLKGCIEATSHCTGLTLILAISYSSRWEITEAARKVACQVHDGVLSVDDITPDVLSASMATAAYPDPDLLIRTGGDHRVSNFLLWQIAYSEIYVTPRYWPDFSADDFAKALADYAGRQRRFGLTGAQIEARQSSSQH